jgi:hypothetical protein
MSRKRWTPTRFTPFMASRFGYIPPVVTTRHLIPRASCKTENSLLQARIDVTAHDISLAPSGPETPTHLIPQLAKSTPTNKLHSSTTNLHLIHDRSPLIPEVEPHDTPAFLPECPVNLTYSRIGICVPNQRIVEGQEKAMRRRDDVSGQARYESLSDAKLSIRSFWA